VHFSWSAETAAASSASEAATSIVAHILFLRRFFYLLARITANELFIEWNLVSLWFMFLVAFPAIYRSVTGWCKRYFSFLTAICTGCLVHFSWSAETAAASSASEAASSIVAHIFNSLLKLSQELQSRTFARPSQFLS
jgi:hypothetical protein